MVLTMKINYICRKLVKNNKSQYITLMLCLIFGVILITSLGLIVFSPIIKDNTMEGGTTRSIAYITFGATSFGSLMFITYSHSLFMKYKSKQIGIFISLGMSRRSIKKILLRESAYILPIGVVVGITFGFLLAYTTWYIIKDILNITEVPYVIGWNGFLASLIICTIAVLNIQHRTARYIKKVDIINIMKNREKAEEVKTGNYIFGIIGMVIAPLGFYLWDRTLRGLLFSNFEGIEIIFAGMIPLGIYLIVTQISTLGELIKRISIKKYYKNIMFYNLLRLKGKQYANTLFVVIILIAITIFMSCISLIGPLAAKQIIEIRYPFDYLIRQSIDQNNNITKEKIFQLADKNNIIIKNYNEIELLQLARKEKFGDEVSITDMVCISEEEYNRVYHDNIDVKPGYYNMYSDDKSRMQLNKLKIINAMIIGKEMNQELRMQNGIHRTLIEGDVSIRREFFVLDNSDYIKFRYNSIKEAVEKQIVFDVVNWEETEHFYIDLKKMITESNEKGLKISGELINKIYYDQPEEVVSYKKITNREYEYWTYKLEAKISGFAEEKNKSIYSLLFIYIGLLSIVSSAVIIYIKVLNTSWQDNTIYKNISLLGANNKSVKLIVTKQLAIIFFLPSIIGSVLGVLLSNLMNSQYLYSSIFMRYSIIFASIFIIAQLSMFLITRFVVIKNQTDFLKS